MRIGRREPLVALVDDFEVQFGTADAGAQPAAPAEESPGKE